jgi:multiple sugar transport system substrate-binding protein
MARIEQHADRSSLTRRAVLGAGVGLGAGLAGGAAAQTNRTGIDAATWSPQAIRAMAGTAEFDTAAECAKVVPLHTRGRVSMWYYGPTNASPQLEHRIYADFWRAFGETYPNMRVEHQNLGYNEMLDKLRVAALGRAAPMIARNTVIWSPEFAAKGQLMEFGPEDVGMSRSDFWPGAMQAISWRGKTYGVPTNNETMALIWNAAIFEEAGLNPEAPPATWDDLVTYSREIRQKTRKHGYGLVARVNAGNTPYRFMPQVWAYGGGALDEADANPLYRSIRLNNAGTKAALQASYDMYVRDRSVPTSALTNTQVQNQDPFIAGQLAMMIAHPTEYSSMVDRAARSTGDDKRIADAVVANMRYGLIPAGPARRAVAFGGSSAQVMKPDLVAGGIDMNGVRALIAFMCSPEWSTKLSWLGSNPGNIQGFRTRWMKQRIDEIRFLDVTTSMLPYGIPFPVIPQSAEIMNIIVPNMMQNALTRRMSVNDAAEDAARKLRELAQEL